MPMLGIVTHKSIDIAESYQLTDQDYLQVWMKNNVLKTVFMVIRSR